MATHAIINCATGEMQYIETADPPDLLDKLKAAREAAVMGRRTTAIDAGIAFGGVRYQTGADDRENIAGAAQLAALAVIAGAQPGDLYWHGGGNQFVWIAEDNSLVPMDAPTVIAFGKAVAAHKSACIFGARALKDTIAAAADQAALEAIDIEVGWPA
jgi:hypothetical protein